VQPSLVPKSRKSALRASSLIDFPHVVWRVSVVGNARHAVLDFGHFFM